MPNPPSSQSSRTVYAVSTGEYSDYAVDCVFEREEDAERYVAAGMGTRVEEMTLFSEMPTIYTIYEATIYKGKEAWSARGPGEMRLSDWRTTDEPKHKVDDMDWAVQVRGADRERVIKSARDRYAKWKAEQEGVS